MSQMKLGEFIAQTLTEIIDGVDKAQAFAAQKNAKINPRHVNWSDTKQSFYISGGGSGPDNAPLVTPIYFDILVSIGEDEKALGGIGIFAASFGIGVKGEVEDHSESVNRIKFRLLARLPQQP